MFEPYLFIGNELKSFIVIAFGSIIGAFIRWKFNNNLLLNVIGSLVLGFAVGYRLRFSLQLLIGVGFCGSLTTFSGWIVNCLKLFSNRLFIDATALIIFPLLIALLAGFSGYLSGSLLRKFSLSQKF